MKIVKLALENIMIQAQIAIHVMKIIFYTMAIVLTVNIIIILLIHY